MDQHPAKEIPVPMARQVKAAQLLLQRKLLRSKAKILRVAAIIKSKTNRERMQKRHRSTLPRLPTIPLCGKRMPSWASRLRISSIAPRNGETCQEGWWNSSRKLPRVRLTIAMPCGFPQFHPIAEASSHPHVSQSPLWFRADGQSV